jgi:hypothetical protein
MKRIEIIPIAEKKSKRREIKREWIDDAITNPAQVVEGYGNRKVAQKMLILGDKKYLLRVVYEETEEVYIIVTAYLTSQIDRYWMEENE